MLCGSIPPGVSTDFYTKLIGMARQAKVKTLLDTDGDALLHGIEACPSIVSPTNRKAERLLKSRIDHGAAVPGSRSANQKPWEPKR